MDKSLEDAMFTKLFLLGGFNQTSFKFLHQEPGVVLWTSSNSPISA
jgi:dolichyl-diphosphooligosaccharide--protein glycosyltransferase